ncbi:hypothetical protein ACFXA3_31225 [Streptomyces sp. NPDC059456]|uniref:hypothetical protein n=1 Tax=Streptomyces sp. NPDC059456 TaxID=3346838 RepID=UPI003696EA5B
MVWASPVERGGSVRAPRGPRRWDVVPGAEVVGACQWLMAWGLLVAAQQASWAGSLVLFGVGSVAAVAVGFLHGLLLVKPLAALGRLTARLTAWPEPVAALVLTAAVSAPAALPAHAWLSGLVASAPGPGAVWAGTAASALLPMAAGAYLRARPVPLRALWTRGLAVTAAVALALVTTAELVHPPTA